MVPRVPFSEHHRQRLHRRHQLRIRRWLTIGLLTLSVGLMVFVLGVRSAWQNSGETLLNNYSLAIDTRSVLRELAHTIATRYRAEHTLPPTLDLVASTLQGISFHDSRRPMLKNGIPIDGWGRPLLYEASTTSFTLRSYGRDGLPGGTNLDADLFFSNDVVRDIYDQNGKFPDKDPISPPPPTLHRFLFELPSRGFLLTAALSGCLAAGLTLILALRSEVSCRNWLFLLLSLGIIIFATWFFGTFIALLHIPTGH